MAGNPLINQGSLNRLRASIIVPGFPLLNLTSPYLGKRGISVAFDGDATTFIDTMTGGVPSPEPYMKVTITAFLVKTLAPAAAYRAQLETAAFIGNFSVIPDASLFPDYDFVNASIQRPDDLSFAGDQADYPVRIGAYYLINNSLFDQG